MKEEPPYYGDWCRTKNFKRREPKTFVRETQEEDGSETNEGESPDDDWEKERVNYLLPQRVVWSESVTKSERFLRDPFKGV